MKAILLEQAGPVENFIQKDIPKPTISSNEVLVEVKAIGVNPVDYKVRGIEEVMTMIYGPERPAILGWDIAGTVSEVGDDVSDFQVGDHVFGMVNFVGAGKAYAEFVAAPANHIAILPDSVSFDTGAASTLAALTALQVLRAKVKQHDKVLIQAGSGGVGHFAIQIAKSLGAYVYTTCSARNKEFVLSLGADEHIDYHANAVEDVLSDIDFVFDMFNGDVLLNSLKVVKRGGKVVSIPTPNFSDEILALAKEGEIDLSFHMVQSSRLDMEEIAKMLESGSLKTHVSQTFTFGEMGNAHTQLESGRTVGKIVVRV